MKANCITLRGRLYSYFFLRNLMTDLFTRKSGNSKLIDDPAPFAYRIGPYCDDYFLYFRSVPSMTRYQNEIFNKMREYSGYEVVQYLEFHFRRSPVTRDFLLFLASEIPARMPRFYKKADRQNLTLALEWTRERQGELVSFYAVPHCQIASKDEFNDGQPEHAVDIPTHTDELLANWSARLSERTEAWIDDTETRFRQLTSSYNTGNIVLNNRNHEDKLIQALILLQQVQAPVQVAKGEQLFNRFTASDIASILQFHFESFRENKINTLQRKVGDQMERLRPNHPRVKKLADALQEFFYS